MDKAYDLLLKDKKTTILSMTAVVILGIVGQLGFMLILVLFIILCKVKKVTFKELGLNRPKYWVRTIALGLLLSVVIIAAVKGVEYVFLGKNLQPDVSRFDPIKANPFYLILTLIFVWLTAGLGEELIWRRFMMKSMATLIGNGWKGWTFSLLITSVLFGSIHLYQGWVGMVQTGLAGVFLGVIFIQNGKHNLWLNAFTHGFINTISLIYIYLSS